MKANPTMLSWLVAIFGGDDLVAISAAAVLIGHSHSSHLYTYLIYGVPTFSALTLFVGWQEGHPSCKKQSGGCWRFYLSGVRSDWFAYGPADAAATPSSLASLKSRMLYLSGASLPSLSWKKAVKRVSSWQVASLTSCIYYGQCYHYTMNTHTHTHTHNRFTAGLEHVRVYPGQQVPER